MYVVDAHSLYLQAMAELGVPGIALLAVLIGVALGGLAVRARGAHRSVYGALLAAGAVWALHAGVDWDWEMPVVTIPFIAAAGLALGPRGVDERAGERLGWAPSRDTRLMLGLACLATLALPVLVIGSQRRLGEAEHALYASNCDAATRAAISSVGWLDVRSQPYEVLGFCDLRRGLPHLGVQAMTQAVVRDRGSWETWYALAIARASAGLDPRSELARAARLEGANATGWAAGGAVVRAQALASNRLSIEPA
jgi:hypothetical protein